METTESRNITNRFVIMSLRCEFDDDQFVLLCYSPIDAPEFCPMGSTVAASVKYQIVSVGIPGRIKY